jgi:predicted nucleic acid-binding protein
LILLDTSVLSRIRRRRKPGPDERALATFVDRLLESEAAVGLPGIVLQEILSGIRDAAAFIELERRLTTSFPIVMATAADHIAAARLGNRCLDRGLTTSATDCLIAALTISGDHQLFALDDDFRQIAKHTPLKLFAYR